jgi:diguanylate cyclase (GGDEF)-like protein
MPGRLSNLKCVNREGRALTLAIFAQQGAVLPERCGSDDRPVGGAGLTSAGTFSRTVRPSATFRVDPNTVVIILALNLISSGGLFLLISRKMPPRSGLATFGAGGVTFGLAYVLRLVIGPVGPAVPSAAADTTMILGALLFTTGVQQFVGRKAMDRGVLASFVLLYLLVFTGVLLTWGAVGRYVLLNAALGSSYAVLTAVVLQAARREAGPLKMPMIVLVGLMGGLALLTLARAANIASEGLLAVVQGFRAQIYYAYAAFAAMLLGPNLLWMVFVRLNRQLVELASRDALTRTLNRNGLDDALTRHFANRSAPPLCWLQADIDHFKRVNDAHGHPVGDLVLREVATTLSRLVRGQDFVARTGGEEFLIGCVDASASTALALGERLREGVAALRISLPNGGEPVTCTLSVGISGSFGSLAEWSAAARAADQALYAAKAGGRNRVVMLS